MKDFFALFPANVDIIFSPGEVGDRIEYLPNDVISDIDWTDIHPIKQVYLNCNCYTGQKMWDPLTVINAVEGNKDFLLSPRGFVEVTDEAQTIFVENEKGNSRYQLPQYSEWNTKILDKIRASD